MLLDKIKQKIDKAEIVSFDIFDTLLVRPYAKPNDLFEHIAVLFDAPGFRRLREEAFVRAREKYCNSENEEVTLAQIYEFVPEKYKYLEEKELELEFQILQPNEELKAVYEYALLNNKRIIIVSDMFLPKSFVEKILVKNGYDKYEKLYLSSEYKKLKFTGSLFKIVLTELEVKPSQILHVGDHKYSDYKTPKKLGMSVVRYRKIIEQFFDKNKKAKAFYSKHCSNLTTSILFGCLALQRNNSQGYWYNLGMNYGGAFILGYMNWLKKELEKDGISEVLFVARDGYTLEKVFNIIDKENKFKTHYLYAPRLISLCSTLDFEDKLKASKFECIDTISSIIEATKAKLDIEVPKLSTKEDYLSFWNDNKETYKNFAALELEKYKDYLSTMNLTQQKVGFVDVMTSFFTAQKLVNLILGAENVKGYYYLVSDKFSVNDKKFIYTKCTNKVYNIQFVELLISSPEAPISGINNFLPIYKKTNKFDEVRMEIYPQISQGEVEFAKIFVEIFGNYLISFDLENLCEWIDDFRYRLDRNDCLKFKTLCHSWDAQHQKYSLIFKEVSLKYRLKILLQQIFSLRNEGDKKVITILGIKIKREIIDKRS